MKKISLYHVTVIDIYRFGFYLNASSYLATSVHLMHNRNLKEVFWLKAESKICIVFPLSSSMIWTVINKIHQERQHFILKPFLKCFHFRIEANAWLDWYQFTGLVFIMEILSLLNLHCILVVSYLVHQHLQNHANFESWCRNILRQPSRRHPTVHILLYLVTGTSKIIIT